MNPLKITIISRAIFPTQSPRAERTKELAIAFSKLGHDVTIYALLGKYDYTKFSNTTGVKVNNIGNSRLGNGNSDTGKKSNNFIFKIFKKLFGYHLLFPGIEITYFVYTLRKKLINNDLIISVAAPFTIHFGVALSKKRLNSKFPKVWISDCGDPFYGNPLIKLPFYFKTIEKWWSSLTNYITIPTEIGKSAYQKESLKKIHIIPQGFQFPKNDLSLNYKQSEVSVFCYSGAVFEKVRDPRSFLEFLCALKSNFIFIVYTKNHALFAPYISRLKNKMIIKDYVTRDALLIELSKMDFLLNIRNESSVQSPSKLIDYNISTRPILEISSNFSEREKSSFKQFLNNDYRNGLDPLNLEKYNINNIVNQFLELYNK